MLTQVAEIWPTLTKNEQAYYLNQQAGANQTQNLAAILQNFNHAIEATATAYDSAGSAARENERYMDSIQASISAVAAEFESFANNVISGDFVKGVLSATKVLLQFLNAPFGNFITQIGLTSAAIYALHNRVKSLKIFDKLFTSLGNGLTTIGKSLSNLQNAQTPIGKIGTALTTAGGAAAGFGKALSNSVPYLSAIVIGIQAAIGIVDALTTSLEEQQEVVSNLKSDISTLNEEYQQLVEIPEEDLTQRQKSRLAYLNAEITAREKLLEIEEREEREIERNEATAAMGGLWNLGDFNAQQRYERSESNIRWGSQWLKNIQDLTAENISLNEQLEKLKENESANADEIERLTNKIAENEANIVKNEEALSELIIEITTFIDAMDKSIEAGDELDETELALYEIGKALIEDYNNWVGTNESLSESLGDLDASGESVVETTEELQDAMSQLSETLSNVDASYSTLQSAVEEYNSTGQISAGTLSKLLELDSEWLNMLEITNGQLSINKEALQKYNDTLIQNALQANAAALGEELLALQASYLEGDVKSAKDVLGDTNDTLTDTATNSSNAALGMMALAQGIRAVTKEQYYQHQMSQWQTGGPGDTPTIPILLDDEDFLTEADKIIEYRRTLDSAIRKLGTSNASFSTGGTGGSSSTEKVLTEEEKLQEKVDARTEAYDQQIAVLEHELFLLEKNNASEDERIAKLKELQGAAHQYAEDLRGLGLGEDASEIMGASESWWGYQDDIVSVLDSIKQKNRDNLDAMIQDVEDYISDRQELDDISAEEEYRIWEELLKDIDELYNKGLVDYEYYMEQRTTITKNQAKLEKQIWDEFWEEEEERWTEEQEEEIKKLESQQQAYEALFGIMAENIQKELDALEEEKAAIEERYQAQIDALNETNEELEDQIALEQALDDLAQARSKKVMVYKDGRFQYVSDVDAVSEATSALETVKREQSLKEEIAAIEAERDKELADIEEEIGSLEGYYEQWSTALSEYEKTQNEMLIQEQLGMDLSGENWKEYIDQVKDYIDKYTELMDLLNKVSSETWEELTEDQSEYLGNILGEAIRDNAGSISQGAAEGFGTGFVTGGITGGVLGTVAGIVGEVTDAVTDRLGFGSSSSNKKPSSSSSGSSGSSSGSSNKNSYKNPANQALADSITAQMKENSEKWHTASAEEKKKLEQANVQLANKYYEELGRAPTYDSASGKWDILEYDAAGTTSAHGGLSMVGEKGPELRVLNSGDGILPADITKNLWQWGTTKPADFLKSFSGLANMGKQAVISIQNLNLPNVQDGPGFVEYMENLANSFWRRTVQFQTSPV